MFIMREAYLFMRLAMKLPKAGIGKIKMASTDLNKTTIEFYLAQLAD
jgi:hypothetical protein